MKTLYIIGNGFDRFHQLDTSYISFGLFLRKKHLTIYNQLIECFGLSELDEYDLENNKDPLWKSFEESLAGLDFETLLEENSDYLPNVASDDFRDGDWHAYQIVMEEIVKNITTRMVDAFKEFILNVDFSNAQKQILKIEAYSFFLNFNYTDSLEFLYDIDSKNILYIHNKAKSNENLILGHGVDPNEFIPEKEIPDPNFTPEELAEWEEHMSDNYDFAYESGKEELMGYFSSSYKPTSDIIGQNSSFFRNLYTIEKVIVLGHSLAFVDELYFRNVIENTKKNIPWFVSYYGDEEKKTHMVRLLSFGLKPRQINLIEMESLIK